MMDIQSAYRDAKVIIPGGTSLLSKRPEMILPEQWPTYYSKAKGITVWDLNGNPYRDFYLMGVGSNTLGYANVDVDARVIECINSGSMCTLNAYEEVKLAERLISIHPWADMARFGKTGADACSMAVRIARAFTGRDTVFVCGYHGCHDWYLAANLNGGDELGAVHLAGLSTTGLPQGLKGTVRTFRYNSIDEFKALCSEYGREVGAVIMEPVRDRMPDPGFLEFIRQWTRTNGVPLIYDEISLGFRLCPGGSHLTLGVDPDLAVFGKAMSNGYPISAVIGRKEVMRCAQDTFLSSTFWTERIGFVAANAVCEIYCREPIAPLLCAIGEKVRHVWERAAALANLDIEVGGLSPLCHFRIVGEDDSGQAWMTLFSQLMLERGFLAGGAFYASVAHDDTAIREYEVACQEAFEAIAAGMLNDANPANLLHGPIAHQKFERLT